ncbi:MAG: hypothetical protein GYA55_09160 [SAR324 cluster bacterium]|uniref:Conjugal transfer protein TraK n=1 Tax=SAR324 cluster bacterium TaxID=2024889 RepID=A0A7X9FS43_9DELT|nr:hypothetical protein [SAR324 cluster bacterium]
MRTLKRNISLITKVLALIVAASLPLQSLARDVDYNDQELEVYVNPGEPTQIQFPDRISGGFKKKTSVITIDKKDTDLVVFAQDALPESGEVIIVRLEDGRSYSLRIRKAGPAAARDDIVRIEDSRPAVSYGKEEDETPAYRNRNFPYAPTNVVSGLMREMILAAEFGKSSISGYRASDRYAGQIVLDDGTLRATVDKIFLGPNLWGYVLDVENLLDQTQKLNPATFRMDGTRAISARNWELAPQPKTVEQKVANQHRTKLYVVTRSKQ